jgi:ketosteroid isomerase-like protein
MYQRFAGLVFTLALVGVPASAQTPTADQQAVLAAVRAFHDALAQGDSLGALKLLADDVAILESGGLETRSDYRRHHLPADITFAKAVPSKGDDPRATILGDIAWVVSTSRTAGTFRGRPINSAGVELMVLSRTHGGWQIRAVHWSSRAVRTP